MCGRSQHGASAGSKSRASKGLCVDRSHAIADIAYLGVAKLIKAAAELIVEAFVDLNLSAWLRVAKSLRFIARSHSRQIGEVILNFAEGEGMGDGKIQFFFLGGLFENSCKMLGRLSGSPGLARDRAPGIRLRDTVLPGGSPAIPCRVPRGGRQRESVYARG